MHLQWSGLLIYLLDLVVVFAVVVWPLLSDYDDDHGDGRALVLLPPPRRVHPFRTVAFFGTFIGFVVVYGSIVNPHVDTLYGDTVGSIAGMIVSDPNRVTPYLTSPALASRFLFVGYILSLAITVRATLPRRLLIAVNVIWYVAAMILVDAGMIVFSILTGLPTKPFTPLGNLAAIGVGLLITSRLLLANLALPRRVALTKQRPRFLGDTVLMLSVVVAVLAFIGTMALLASTVRIESDVVLLALLAPFLLPHLFFGLVFLVLFVLKGLSPDPPVDGSEKVPIDVIIPAYNEELFIRRTLEAIDRAAVRYGGPVRAIVGDDGSTDRTRELALETIREFHAATGDVVSEGHGGKSHALNVALGRATSEIVLRIDADVVVDEWALYYTPRWFRDPAVGNVSALSLPQPNPSWISRMRLFECLIGFGFSRRATQLVDAIACVPGVFSAFRRPPVVAFGGFTKGMNGEDADMTLQLGRLGYRACLDPKIRVYEDAPRTIRGLREQRTRWYRATLQLYARHAPFRGGLTGPRLWFSMLRSIFYRITGPFYVMVGLYLLALIVLQPAAIPDLRRVGVLIVLALAPSILLGMVLAVRYGHAIKIPWLLLWLPFSILRRIFDLEAVLSLPARPVRIPLLSRNAVETAPRAPVLH